MISLRRIRTSSKRRRKVRKMNKKNRRLLLKKSKRMIRPASNPIQNQRKIK